MSGLSNDDLKKKAAENAAFLPPEWISMTEATERLWGTSGRGNPNCVRLIEACARMGTVEIRPAGRFRRQVRRSAGVPGYVQEAT